MEDDANGEEKFDPNRLSMRFVEGEFTDRTFAMGIARLAVELAREAGEEVRRPLSEHQLARALHVNQQETRKVFRLLDMRWEQMHYQGELGDSYRPAPKKDGSG